MPLTDKKTRQQVGGLLATFFVYNSKSEARLRVTDYGLPITDYELPLTANPPSLTG